jgi:putative ABC transport system permease protein
MGEKYRTPVQQNAFFEQLSQQARALPGVDSVATVFPLPFSGPILNRPFAIPGRPVDPAQELSTQYNIVSPEYFRALGIRVTQGRSFTERDQTDAPLVVMINETLARRIWPDENPIGKRISIGMNRAVEREVVGVFADIKQRQLDSEPLLHVCVPHRQEPFRLMYLAVRGQAAATTLLPALRQRIVALDQDLPIIDAALWSERVTSSIAPRRVTMWLLAAFATTALLLAVVGLYGVMSYMVTQRTREFGIRVALGAQWADLLRMVVGHGMKLVALGVVIGLAGAFAISRVIAGLLFEVSPTDPLTFVGVASVLAVAAATACWLPARRAAGVDPMISLRAE